MSSPSQIRTAESNAARARRHFEFVPGRRAIFRQCKIPQINKPQTRTCAAILPMDWPVRLESFTVQQIPTCDVAGHSFPAQAVNGSPIFPYSCSRFAFFAGPLPDSTGSSRSPLPAVAQPIFWPVYHLAENAGILTKTVGKSQYQSLRTPKLAAIMQKTIRYSNE